MRIFIGYATLVAALCACPVTLSFAQGATGSNSPAATSASNSGGASGTSTVGIPSPSMGSNSSGNNATTGGMSQSYASAPMANPGTPPSGMRSGSTQTSIPVTNSGRLNGTASGSGTSTPAAAAGRPCGLSLSDPTSGSLTPLTQPLSPGSAAGGCE